MSLSQTIAWQRFPNPADSSALICRSTLRSPWFSAWDCVPRPVPLGPAAPTLAGMAGPVSLFHLIWGSVGCWRLQSGLADGQLGTWAQESSARECPLWSSARRDRDTRGVPGCLWRSLLTRAWAPTGKGWGGAGSPGTEQPVLGQSCSGFPCPATASCSQHSCPLRGGSMLGETKMLTPRCGHQI